MARSKEHIEHSSMRSAHDAMALPRLGSHYPSRLSFMRVLTRTMLKDRWNIEQTSCRLDKNGIGEILYTLTTPRGLYTFVAFTHETQDNSRTDCAIADNLDMTATLCTGEVTEAHLEKLRHNVPQQEKGRLDGRSLVLTRATQISRNFSYVANCLASGEQPGFNEIANVGYLYRTTVVYGSGKFGMCDWEKIQTHHPDFNRPFAAEMFACFILRQVSFDVVEHVARQRAPERAAKLASKIKRYFGIGNSTGLGMAPFLICHPLLIQQWIECRELALARVCEQNADKPHRDALSRLLKRAQQHLTEIVSSNEQQNAVNAQTAAELSQVVQRLGKDDELGWTSLLKAADSLTLDAQEALVSCLIELYPELVDELADNMVSNESFDIRPEQSLSALKQLIETRYSWALSIDFSEPDSRRMFWYRSADKMEPRLGEVNVDDGEDRQMCVDIARQTNELYEYVCEHLNRHPGDRIAHFLINLPMLRYIVRRVQTMSQTRYGEIRANLLDTNIEPTKLMRCKLAFFGASKFDPQSRLWVRNTMYQGAPTVDDINQGARAESDGVATDLNAQFDDWSFPVQPTAVSD